MKRYNYIPLPTNVVLVLMFVFAAGGISSIQHDLTHPAKGDPSKEKQFEVYINDSSLPHQASFERNSGDDQFRVGSQDSFDLIYTDFVESIRPNFIAERNSGNALNRIDLFASPLFLVNRVFQI
ncbi:MAG TPA: hypothetical protein VFE50_23050 [Cyclobacteriaceae bacterium]|nr:hypothetical protein [Cyclobacteriaceae bacterium]